MNAPAEVVVAAEVVGVLPEPEAKRLDQRIRLTVKAIEGSLDKLRMLVAQARAGSIHTALGFPSWTAYLSYAVRFEPRNRDERRDLVALLADEGLSQRAIADMVAASQGTVSRDVQVIQNESPAPARQPVTGRDGKSYRPPPLPAARPEPRRRPLTDVFEDETRKLTRAAEHLEKLCSDDCFVRNRSAIASQNLFRLNQSRDTLSRVLAWAGDASPTDDTA